jgi:hypothetical protein
VPDRRLAGVSRPDYSHPQERTMLVSILSRLFGKKSARRPAPKPLRRRPGLEQLETRDCPSTITLVGSGYWTADNTSIWSTHTVPTSADDVILTGPYSVYSGGNSVHSLKLDSAFTGGLYLYGAINVNPNGDSTGGLEVDNGKIDQPGGANAPLNVDGGYFNWAAGILNSTTTLAAVNLTNVTADVTGGDKATNSNFNIDGTTIFKLDMNGTWTFNENAGINIAAGGTFIWQSAGASIATTGTGFITNSGGEFTKAKVSGGGTVMCDLPYVNNNSGASLTVQTGTLEFTRAGSTNGVSVFQSDGSINLSQDGLSTGQRLKVDKGFQMSGGTLTTGSGQQPTQITGGDVLITGGTVKIGGSGVTTGELDCTGAVTMNGGTLEVDVDFGGMGSADLWKAKNFLIGNTAKLSVLTYRLPNPLPSGKKFTILDSALAQDGVTGDFTNSNNIPITGTKKLWKAGPDAAKTEYDLTTP